MAAYIASSTSFEMPGFLSVTFVSILTILFTCRLISRASYSILFWILTITNKYNSKSTLTVSYWPSKLSLMKNDRKIAHLVLGRLSIPHLTGLLSSDLLDCAKQVKYSFSLQPKLANWLLWNCLFCLNLSTKTLGCRYLNSFGYFQQLQHTVCTIK